MEAAVSDALTRGRAAFTLPTGVGACRVRALPSQAQQYFTVASSQQLAQLDRLERQVTTLVAAYQQLREELADANVTVAAPAGRRPRARTSSCSEYQNQENIVKLVQTIAGGNPPRPTS
ncbi:MAG: hypothetical protein WKG07_31095 [Hymenobacter sp.]